MPDGRGATRVFHPCLRPQDEEAVLSIDYRHTDGELFSCVAPTLEECRRKRNEWLQRKTDKEAKR